MESKSQAMEKAIDGQYYCQRLLHSDKISSTMLYWFACFIIFIIGRWIDNNLVNRLLFLPPLLLQFLFEHLFQNLFPRDIIDSILSYIYISVCKSILSILKIGFIGQSMLVSMVKSLNLLSHLSPTPLSTTKEMFFNFLRPFYYIKKESFFLFCEAIIMGFMALGKFFPKYFDTSLFTFADFPSWLHILFEKELINNDTRTLMKDIQIKRGEVEFVLSNIGISLSKEVDEIKDCMSHEEFSTLFDQTEPGLHEVEEAFSVFDQNRDGFIDAKELQTVLINLGLRKGTHVNACQSMIDRHDRNRKQKIDRTNFFKLLEYAINRVSYN